MYLGTDGELHISPHLPHTQRVEIVLPDWFVKLNQCTECGTAEDYQRAAAWPFLEGRRLKFNRCPKSPNNKTVYIGHGEYQNIVGEIGTVTGANGDLNAFHIKFDNLDGSATMVKSPEDFEVIL